MFEKLKLIITIKELIRILNENFDTAETNIQGSSDELKQLLESERVSRENADNQLQTNIDNLEVIVNTNKTDSENRDTALDEKVDGININLTKQIDDLEQDVNDKYNELVRDIDDLTDVVEEDYAKLNTKIDTTAQTINTRITNVADELNQTIEDNVVALQQEDTALQNQINTHSQQITKEISDRTNADTTLNNRITEVAEDLNVTIEENVTALQQADTNLQNQITTNKNDISDLTQVVQDDYDELKDLIDQEIEDRENADNNLQEQIDGITAGADVRDIVGTYAQLQAYDKTKLGDNDIIKVLTDETKENASTYYRFSVTSQDYTYIGKEGPFYTKSETDGLLNDKQDTISDLEQIRTNAQTGANLVTQVGTNTTDIGNLKLNKADKSELPAKLSDLQDDITNILGSELNYENSTLELLNSTGETLSSVTIKSTPDLDNKTINLNSDSQLQSIGSILQSGGYQKYWQGTKSEYEAIQVKDPDTLYEVLDDIVDIVTEIPTATSTDIGLVKPDNATITVDDTGTLSVPSSFLLNHNSSNLAHVDVFNTKANTNLNNVSDNIDFVVESGTYGDGESGYKKYKSKYMVEYGKVTSSASGETEFTIHKPYKNTTFSVFAQVCELGNYFVSIYPSGNQKFKLRVQSSNGTNMAVRVSWFSVGYSA